MSAGDPPRAGDGRREPSAPAGPARHSLCPTCRHVQRVESAKGSVFWLCGRAKSDPRFPKYPPQPVVSCAGHAR